jgi:predicted RNA methylase
MDFPEHFKQYGTEDPPGTIQKKAWNITIAENLRFKSGLDLFAGVGFSTWLYSQCCEHVIAIEKDKERFTILKKNMTGIENVELIQGNNLNYLKDCKERFDLVDVDPFGGANHQLPFIEKIMDAGVVLINTGEIVTVYRNIGTRPPFMKKNDYIGSIAWRWAEECYVPHIEQTYGLTVKSFYAYQHAVRLVCTKGGFDFPKLVFPGKQYIGWFAKYANMPKGFNL